MKHSIKKIFNNLKILLIFAGVFSILGYLFFLQQGISYTKIDNLTNQKKIISSLKDLQRDDIELALIQFNGKSTQLLQNIRKLRNIEQYNFINKFVLNSSNAYLSSLDKLEELTKEYNKNAHSYYVKDKKHDAQNAANLENSFNTLNTYIDSIILSIVNLNSIKVQMFEGLFIALLVIMIAGMFWYVKRLNRIYEDLLFLYAVEENKKAYQIFSEEADAIALRMKKKNEVTHDPSSMDPVTEINNYKGMLSAYAAKKGMKESNFTSVTIVEIDNFSKQNRVYPQDVTQAILKKVAFTISLYEQPTDVIARTDYNQFTIILSRPSKEQAFKDIEMIRQSIAELKFKLPKQEIIQITITGAFVIKPNNKHLDDTIKQAKEILRNTRVKGKDKIYQPRDLVEEDF